MTKAEVRLHYLEKRNALSEGEYLALNQTLCKNFFIHTDLSFIKVVHCFLPITEKREPDTWLIIDRIRREFPHIRISIPKVNNKTGELENFYFEGLHQLEKNKWGVPEPRQGIPTPNEKIDMVIVPLLAFDRAGHRVGYGKGYYDKFLAHFEFPVRKIGVSFFPPEGSIDYEPRDIILSACITPERNYIFNS